MNIKKNVAFYHTYDVAIRHFKHKVSLYIHVWLYIHVYICVCVYIYVCVRAKSLQSCLTVCDPMDCSLPGSSVCRILQGRILEWDAVPSPSGSSRPRD